MKRATSTAVPHYNDAGCIKQVSDHDVILHDGHVIQLTVLCL